MIEVLWHGRGGQGAFTAARLLGAAASLADGRYALAFPSFGPERRGAPMRAFTKLSDAPIGDRSAITQADYVIYLDDTLLGEGWEDELKPGGVVLINSVQTFDDNRILAIDADGISADILGRPIPNTVFLGALSALCDQLKREDVQEAIRQYMPEKLHAKNSAIVDAAFHQVVECVDETVSAAHHPVQSVSATSCPERSAQREVEGPRAATAEARAVGTVEDPSTPHLRCSAQDDKPVRPSVHIPTLRTDELDPTSYARTTCFEAGYLVAKNAGWRNIRPVVDLSACTGCLQCYLYCPDGTIYKVPSACQSAETLADVIQPARNQTFVAIDYDFCKGCGICARMCKFGAIAMISEKEALAAETAGDRESEASAR